MSNTCHSPGHRPQRRAWGLANSTSLLGAYEAFWCQNGWPVGCRDAGWWALFKWPRAQKVGTDGVALYQYPGSHLSSTIFWPRSWFPAVLVARAACYQYWPYKGLCLLAPSGRCLKIYVAAVGREFRRWGPNVGAIGWPMWINLIEWHLLVRSASNEEFKCFQPEAFSLPPYFFEENETVHLQPHLPCFGNNLFENNTVRVHEPTKLDENSGFSFPWSDKSYCDWWA